MLQRKKDGREGLGTNVDITKRENHSVQLVLSVIPHVCKQNRHTYTLQRTRTDSCKQTAFRLLGIQLFITQQGFSFEVCFACLMPRDHLSRLTNPNRCVPCKAVAAIMILMFVLALIYTLGQINLNHEKAPYINRSLMCKHFSLR